MKNNLEFECPNCYSKILLKCPLGVFEPVKEKKFDKSEDGRWFFCGNKGDFIDLDELRDILDE